MQKKKSVRQQLKIIEAIAAARQDANLSRRELSLRVGAHSNLMQNIEKGDRDVTVSEFITIAKEIGIDPIELFRRAVK